MNFTRKKHAFFGGNFGGNPLNLPVLRVNSPEIYNVYNTFFYYDTKEKNYISYKIKKHIIYIIYGGDLMERSQ